jgi:hypothetical protein
MLLKADLWWLDGFPSGRAASGAQPWTVLGAPGRPAETIAVSARHLSRATYALRKLTGEHRRVLGEVVPEGACWCAAAARVIEALKPAVHASAMLPHAETLVLGGPRLVRRARQRMACGAFAHEIASAIVWCCATSPERLDAWLSALGRLDPWLDGLRSNVRASAVVTTLELVGLVAELGLGPVTVLLDLLADPRIHSCALASGEHPQRLRHLLARSGSDRTTALPARPDAPLGAALEAWVGTLADLERDDRRRALELLALFDPRARIADWDTWWSRVGASERKLRQVLAAPRPLVAREVRDKLDQRLQKTATIAPAPLVPRYLLDLIAWYLRVPDKSFTRSVCRVLAALTAAELAPRPPTLVFADHCCHLHQRSGGVQAARAVAGLEAYLEATQGIEASRRAAPWAPFLAADSEGKTPPRYQFETELLDQTTDARLVASFYRTLAMACASGEIDPRFASRLLDVHDHGIDPRVAIAMTHDLAPVYLSRGDACFIARFAGDDVDRARAVLAALVRYRKGGDVDPAMHVFRVMARSGHAEVAVTLLATSDIRRLARVGRTLAALRRDIAPRVQPARDLGWLEVYPQALRPALTRLAAHDPRAETTAHRQLMRHFPRVSEIQRELAALRQRLQVTPLVTLERRVARLEARLGEPPRVSASRLARLAARIEAAQARAILRDLEEQTQALLDAELGQLFAPDGPPAWALEERMIDRLLPALALAPPMRQLAARLWRLRAGDPPWDLRDDPQNQRFLRALAARGIRAAPWLDGSERLVIAHGERRVTLAFEDDPLEIFAMGAHFKTCLSPGQFNYFSVFANAADINKRVLYARDDEGRVLGRCLMALTASGAILVFHPYAHATSLAFADRVREYAEALAAAMGTHVVSRGEVPRLVAPEWYDDGPVDLCRRFAFLEQGSAFRRKLGEMAADELLATVEGEIAPLPLNELVLSLFIELAEVQERPELARVVVLRLAELAEIPSRAAVTAARCALRAGDRALAERAFLHRVERHLIDGQRLQRWFDLEAAEVLLALDPVRVLRMLRATRGARRGRDRDREDFTAERLFVEAQAHEALDRPRQALVLYQRSVEHGVVHAARARCVARIAALGERLARGRPRGGRALRV